LQRKYPAWKQHHIHTTTAAAVAKGQDQVSRTLTVKETDRETIHELERTGERLAAVRNAIGKVIFGQEKVVDLALTTILAGGHALLVGAPGLAKTKLATCLGLVLGLAERRVQFTPDLMPADILGAEVLEETDHGRRHFRFVHGPVFCQLLMADEINRASPRTQSALLQSMQEKHVTVAGVRHDLPAPFHVLATQNPIEQEGTYPLPEAQLDRFLMEIDVPYPSLEAERRMLFATTGTGEENAEAILSAKELMAAQHLVRMIPVGESVSNAILSLVRSARPGDSTDEFINTNVAWGPSPRASQALMLGVKARVLLEGRLSPSIDDVLALATPVMRHRMAVTFASRAEGVSLDDVIERVTRPLR
jgi:MoxR-like ATPase